MEIYLLRHGVTDWNSAFRIQGDTDIPLNDIGRKMAVQTAEKLKEKGIAFERVFSSPLSRAVETAKIVSGFEHVVTDERLNEMNFGHMEGQSMKELNGIDPFVEYFKNDCLKYDIEAAKEEDIESFASLISRAADFMKSVIESEELKKADADFKKENGRDLRVLISGHGAMDQAVLFHVKRIESIADFWKSSLLGNCSIAVMDYNPENGLYTMKEENMVLFEESLKKLVPKLI